MQNSIFSHRLSEFITNTFWFLSGHFRRSYFSSALLFFVIFVVTSFASDSNDSKLQRRLIEIKLIKTYLLNLVEYDLVYSFLFIYFIYLLLLYNYYVRLCLK